MGRGRRGQAAVMDLFISLAVFIILITILTLTWDLYHIRLTKRLDYDDMVIKTMQLSDTLLKTPGMPADWTNASVEIVGLARGEREIDPFKLQEFLKMDETRFKDLMHIQLYEVYIVVKQITVSGSASALAQFGSRPGGKYAVNLMRYGSYLGADIALEVSLWQ